MSNSPVQTPPRRADRRRGPGDVADVAKPVPAPRRAAIADRVRRVAA